MLKNEVSLLFNESLKEHLKKQKRKIMRWVAGRAIPHEKLYTLCIRVYVNDRGLLFGVPGFHVVHVNIPAPGPGFFLRSYLKVDCNYC